MDPVTLMRLSQARQREFLEQAAQDREPRIVLIRWSSMIRVFRAFVQRLAQRQPKPSHASPDITACE
ncbi:MAG TPA: hypothetical protein VHD90_06205 [Phototrophicaceae bacterium]|nr:hypothetical protein [Phototrophicaceae bacterium]